MFFEPFRIKVVEPIKKTTFAQREFYLREVHYNLFNIRAENVLIDFLTDSGTSAMSAKQWGALMEGDESYAGSQSYEKFVAVVSQMTGMNYVVPTHQGRASERILFHEAVKEGDIIPSNTHFDTTRANIEFRGASALDLVIDVAKKTSFLHPFKGNIDIEKLKILLKKTDSKKIPLCLLTITNNSCAGQPVSLQNIADTKKLLSQYDIPLFIDAARFAENAYFIKMREEGFQNQSIPDIVRKLFSYADGILMSAKKDGFGNIGGFLAFKEKKWVDLIRNFLIMTEGFPTYGGLAGRDLEALAQGFKEVVDEDYLEYRGRSLEKFGSSLKSVGIPIVEPVGGHAVYIDAKELLPHIPALQYPGQSLVVELYRMGGIRTVEIGSCMFGKVDQFTKKEVSSDKELVRLAVPRRVYTQSHLEYVVDVLAQIYKKRNALKGFKIIQQDRYLRHFTAQFEPL
ncbi:MAG: tryptophanase [Deltaproteobacteria bacterium]|nr:tryptophanase [Deltaproteobacteria bacterium]